MAIGESARVALGWIRLVNGAAALLVPGILGRRMTRDVGDHAAVQYPYRLFGIRTVILGLDLLLSDASRNDMLKRAVLIHGIDTASAVKAGRQPEIDRRFARAAVVISSVNTVLAVIGLCLAGDTDREGC